MKKLLVFALVLVFTGAAVFAVDLGDGFSIAGEVKAGVTVFTQDDGDSETDDTIAALWNDDGGLSAGLTFGYENDLGGAKAKFTAKGDSLKYDGTHTSPTVDYNYAFGWINLLEKKIVVHGGHIDPQLWGSGGVVDKKFDNVKGVRAAFNVVDGLSFGFALPVSGTDPVAIGDTFGGLAFGAKYTADMFNVAVSMKLNPENATTTTDKETGVTTTIEHNSWVQAALGVEILPIDVLKVHLSAYIDTASDKDADKTGGMVQIGPKVTYAANGLEAFVQGNIKLLLNDVAGKKVDGAPGTLKPKEEGGTETTAVGFKVGASYKVDLAKPYLEIDSDNLLFLTTDEETGGKDAGLNVKAGVDLTLGTCTVGFFDKITGIAKFKADGDGVPSPIANQFQINFKWAF